MLLLHKNASFDTSTNNQPLFRLTPFFEECVTPSNSNIELPIIEQNQQSILDKIVASDNEHVSIENYRPYYHLFDQMDFNCIDTNETDQNTVGICCKLNRFQNFVD